VSRRRFLVTSALLLAGCDRVFGLTPPPGDDAQATPRDGLVFPPDGAATCPPRPVIESWEFTSVPPPAAVPTPPTAFAFYPTPQGLGVLLLAGNRLWDARPGEPASPIASLDPPGMTFLGAPRMSPDGAALWFVQSGATPGQFRAAAAAGWVKQRADLGFVDARDIEPGSVGYHAGEARMVVAVRDANTSPRLHELASPDGLTWSALDTIGFDASGLGDRNPALSPDGCFLIYVGSQGSATLRIVGRDPDGVFRTPITIPTPGVTSPSFPVLPPTADALWFVFVVGETIQYFRGAPP
jgi:hypothetical protein